MTSRHTIAKSLSSFCRFHALADVAPDNNDLDLPEVPLAFGVFHGGSGRCSCPQLHPLLAPVDNGENMAAWDPTLLLTVLEFVDERCILAADAPTDDLRTSLL